MSEKAVITCKKNGPYLVSGLETLTAADGSAVETKATIALCRCGGSANKPFCDGTHNRNGFDDAKSPDRTPDQRDSYAGAKITIHDNRGLCAHAGACTDGLPAVWRMNQEPWIDPDGADVEAIIATIAKCPSGALSYSVDGAAPAGEDGPSAISALKDGPFRVSNCDGPQADDPVGEPPGRTFTLCRCGASKNKPYCDGSHWDAGFKDDGTG